MTKFSIIPFNEITINEIQYYKLQNLLDYRITPQGATFGWTDGIVYSLGQYPIANDQVVADELKGIFHWGAFDYSHMAFYKQLVYNSNQIAGQVIDQTGSKTMEEFIKWLKLQKFYVEP